MCFKYVGVVGKVVVLHFLGATEFSVAVVVQSREVSSGPRSDDPGIYQIDPHNPK